ncbi:MAG: DUF892 family protein [Waddliaceae bacterium]
MKTLYDLCLHELKDLYNAADYMHQVLKRMSSSATNPKLVQMLDTYYRQVQHQKEKLREFFAKYSVDIDQARSPIMSKIRDHGLASMRFEGSKEIRDLALLLTLNMMKHFEKTAFGTLLTHANRMKHEEIIDMLLSLRKKIAKDEKQPMAIASDIMEETETSELKREVEVLLGRIVKAHVRDENQLLTLIPQLISEVNVDKLKEALETYQFEHQAHQEELYTFLTEFQNASEIEGWSVMDGFALEWKKDLSAIGSQALKAVGVILSIQRIQHQNMALFEFEERLSRHLGHSEMQKRFEYLFEQEMGNDQSFTAIAEGSIFEEGLDAKVK